MGRVKILRLVIASLLVCLVVPGATLRVVVRDSSGGIVVGATLRAGGISLRTGPNGEAVFADLPAGRASVAVEAEGFAPFCRTVTLKNKSTTLQGSFLELGIALRGADRPAQQGESGAARRPGVVAVEERRDRLPRRRRTLLPVVPAQRLRADAAGQRHWPV